MLLTTGLLLVVLLTTYLSLVVLLTTDLLLVVLLTADLSRIADRAGAAAHIDRILDRGVLGVSCQG